MEGQVRPNRPVRTGILVAMFFLVACVAQSDSQQPQTRHNRMLQLLSRHRRVAQPSPQRGNAFKTLQEQEENKFKPVFRDCEKWNSEQHRPVVEEESRKGKTNVSYSYWFSRNRTKNVRSLEKVRRWPMTSYYMHMIHDLREYPSSCESMLKVGLEWWNYNLVRS